jgi:general secretion pathway protein J
VMAPTRQAVVTLGLDEARSLTLRWTPYLHARWLGPPPAPQASELLRGVEGLDIAYWSGAPGGGWVSSWAGTDLPALLRIRLRFGREDGRRWPDIIVAPKRERPDD